MTIWFHDSEPSRIMVLYFPGATLREAGLFLTALKPGAAILAILVETLIPGDAQLGEHCHN